MIIIRININHEENRTIIEKKEAKNVFVVKNIFSRRKSHIEEAYVNV